MVELLTIFDKMGGKFKFNKNSSGAGYHSETNTLTLGDGAYKELGFLAHELVHAAKKAKKEGKIPEAAGFLEEVDITDEKYETAESYSKAKQKIEGEAIYYEYKVLQQIGQSFGKT